MNEPRVSRAGLKNVLISCGIAAGLLIISSVVLVPLVWAAPGTISGTVTYYGNRPGRIGIQLSVFTTTAATAPDPVATGGTDTVEGAYSIEIDNVEEGAYYVFTYLDVNENYNYDPGEEPYAWYDYDGNGQPDRVTVAPGGTTRGIDILLTDLWQPLGGPLGQVNAIAARPGVSGTLYAAVGGPFSGRNASVYSTSNGGLSWSAVYTAANNRIAALAVSDLLIYASGETTLGTGLIVRSPDGGASWSPVYTGSGQDAGAIRDVAIDAATPTTAYAVGYERSEATSYSNVGTVYRTTNGGDLWTPTLTISESDLLAVAVNPVMPSIVFAGGYYRATGTHYAALFRSTDGGVSWSEVLTATDGATQQFTDIIVHPTTPNIVFAGTQNPKWVFRSTDGGLSWEGVVYDRGFRLAIDPPMRVYAPDDWRELAVSTDNGVTWTMRIGEETPDDMMSIALDLAATPPGGLAPLYLGFRERGIYRSDDGGLTWTPRNTGLVPTTAPRHIEIDPQNQELLYVAAGCDGAWRTGDHGATWTRLLEEEYCVETLAVHPQDSGVVYAGITGSADSAVMRAENGVDFTTSLAGSADIHAIEIARTSTDRVLAGGENAGAATLVRSTDAGASWTEVLNLVDGAVTALAIHPTDAAIALAGVRHRSGAGDIARLYRTTDGGDNWAMVYDGGAGAIHSIVFDQERPDNAYATDSRSVLKSADGGATWLPPLESFGEDNRNLVAIDPRLADHVYLVGPGYIAETIDGGATWSDWQAPINQGTERRTATALAVSQGGITQTLYAGFEGVWFYNRPSPQTSDFTTERVLANLAQPTAIDWAPDGRMFIAHQSGLVLVYDGETTTEFIDISAEVNNNWNRGLIGIAVHPDFPEPPYVYLLYSYDPPDLPGAPGAVDGQDGYGARVSRLLRVTANGPDFNTADRNSGEVILGKNSTLANIGDPADSGGDAGLDPACTAPNGSPIVDCLPSEGPSHSIGDIVFGHDGMLWVTNGEGAPYITPDYRAGRAQDPDSLGGKVLRIHPETGLGLPDNPFYNDDTASNRSRVWAMGLRNPFRVALHPEENILYLGDVGWYAWEEINYGGEAHNFGWPCYEGGASGNLRHSLYDTYAGTAAYCQPLYDAEPNNGIEPPLYAYQNIAGAAVVAGDFYTGTRYPARFQDALFIADYDKRTISYLTFDESGGAIHSPFMEEISALGGPVDLRLGPDGYLYFVALNPDPGGESEIRRILHTSAPAVQIDASPRYGLDVPLTVQFTSTLSTEDTEGLLSYLWAFGDGNSAAESHPMHTYTAAGTYTAILTVTTPQGQSSADRIAIVVGDAPPIVTINQPLAGSEYTMGSPLSFSGQAVDATTGQPLTADNLQWRAQWFFNEHLHSPFYSLDGVGSGSFTVPLHNDNTTMFLCLTAVDHLPELRDPTTCIELQPRTVPYTFLSTPTNGFTLTYEGVAYTTPFTVNMMVGARRSIGAPATQGGLPFAFWSNGGSRTQEIVGQSTAQTLTAAYGNFIYLPLIVQGAGR